MRRIKKFLSVLCCITCMFGIAATAHAQELDAVLTPDPVGTTVRSDLNSDGSLTRGSGYIINGQLYMTKTGVTTMKVNAYVSSYDPMEKIGYKYVTLQRLENGTWRDYMRWGDEYSYNTVYNNFVRDVSVAPGYGYRLVSDLYAQRSSWLVFTDSETIHMDTAALYM